MSEAVPLPPRPNLEQYRKLAKDLQRACQSGEAEAVRAWVRQWVETLVRLNAPEMPPRVGREIGGGVEWQWRKLKPPCTLAGAQFFIARCHGFGSWPKFAKHVQAVETANSPAARFERAADAIVNGDLPALREMVADSPDLVRARSPREHRSTLLHYVSANGVEDFRQKTPKNIVEITRLLLEAGADVSAESDAYGGGSTALDLAATSCHPEDAGVQIPLLELLIERGAAFDGSLVVACLHNGRGEAARYLASRGVPLDLEGAAGTGRLDVVQSFFNSDGTLRPPATQEQLTAGFGWACEFGRNDAVEFLLQNGVRPGTLLRGGETGLHWAAMMAEVDTIRLLLRHGAPVDVVDSVYDAVPLGWALYGWLTSYREKPHHETVALLVSAGAKPYSQWLNPDGEWLDGDAERRELIAKLRSDPSMQAALRGEAA